RAGDGSAQGASEELRDLAPKLFLKDDSVEARGIDGPLSGLLLDRIGERLYEGIMAGSPDQDEFGRGPDRLTQRLGVISRRHDSVELRGVDAHRHAQLSERDRIEEDPRGSQGDGRLDPWVAAVGNRHGRSGNSRLVRPTDLAEAIVGMLPAVCPSA